MGHALLIVVVEPDTPPGEMARRIDELLEPYDQESETVERVVLDEQPCECTDQANGAADPQCQVCGGTGKIEFTFNPQETFDWYGPGADGTARSVPVRQPRPGAN
jgi:hypothetical protein